MPTLESPKVEIETVGSAIPETTRLQMQNLLLQQQVYQEQLNSLVLQFLLHTPQPKVLQEKIEEITKQINKMAAELFATAGVDPQQCQFNVEEGVFIPRPPNKPKTNGIVT